MRKPKGGLEIIMTRKSKILISILAVICVIAVAAGTTLALLISLSGPVENTFTIGDIRLTLTETTGQAYQLIPGAIIHKDPKVTVGGGSVSCWLFIKITESADFDDYLNYTIDDSWTNLGGYDGVYYRQVTASNTDLHFPVLKDNSVTVNDNITKERMSNITVLPSMALNAYAVQSEGVNTALEAWWLVLEENEE